jgi:hypothetical protein
VAVPLDEEEARVRQQRAPDRGAERAEPPKRDGEAGDMPDDRDGLAGVGAGDLQERRRDAGVAGLVRAILPVSVVPEETGANSPRVI